MAEEARGAGGLTAGPSKEEIERRIADASSQWDRNARRQYITFKALLIGQFTLLIASYFVDGDLNAALVSLSILCFFGWAGLMFSGNAGR